MSSEQTPTQPSTSQPRIVISSLQSMAIEGPATHEELPKTPLNSPQDVVVPDDDNISEHDIATIQSKTTSSKADTSGENEKKNQDELSHEAWYEQNEPALLTSLAHVIAARNKTARQSGGEPVIFEKNIFVPESDTMSSDLADLYHHYNEVWASVMYHLNKDEARACEYEPDLPARFGKANTKEKKSLSENKLTRLMSSPDDNPWKSLDVGKIFARTQYIYKKWLEEEVDDGMNSACFQRKGHFCKDFICRLYDRESIEILTHLEKIKAAAGEGLEGLSDKDPKVYDATINFKQVQSHAEKAVEGLDKYMKSEKDKTQTLLRNMREAYDKVKSGEDTQNLLAAALVGDHQGYWADGWYWYIRNVYTMRKFFYNLHIIMAANSDGKEDNLQLPPTFPYFWGSEKAQRKHSAVFVKETITSRQSELLMRAGWAPFAFMDRVHDFVHRLYLDKWSDLPLSARRPYANAIAGQAINYLCLHLFWHWFHQRTLKPTDPTWVWQLSTVPQSVEDDRPIDPCTLMWTKYKEEALRDDCLETYLPLGFRDAETQEDQSALSESWIKDVIQPVADYFFSKQGWNFSEAALVKHYQKLEVEEERSKPRIKKAVDAEKAYQKILSCSTISFITSATKEQLALIPDSLFGQDKDRQVDFNAVEYLKQEKAKLDPLINHALAFLLAAEGTYGTSRFRNSSSRAVQLAAKKAVEKKDGLRLVPIHSSILCECENEEDHKLHMIDSVARGMCEKLDINETVKRASKAGFTKL